jgi:hypothetical protein
MPSGLSLILGTASIVGIGASLYFLGTNQQPTLNNLASDVLFIGKNLSSAYKKSCEDNKITKLDNNVSLNLEKMNLKLEKMNENLNIPKPIHTVHTVERKSSLWEFIEYIVEHPTLSAVIACGAIWMLYKYVFKPIYLRGNKKLITYANNMSIANQKMADTIGTSIITSRKTIDDTFKNLNTLSESKNKVIKAFEKKNEALVNKNKDVIRDKISTVLTSTKVYNEVIGKSVDKLTEKIKGYKEPVKNQQLEIYQRSIDTRKIKDLKNNSNNTTNQFKTKTQLVVIIFLGMFYKQIVENCPLEAVDSLIHLNKYTNNNLILSFFEHGYSRIEGKDFSFLQVSQDDPIRKMINNTEKIMEQKYGGSEKYTYPWVRREEVFKAERMKCELMRS